MKKITLLLIITIGFTSNAQTYKPFPSDSATWGFYKSNPSGPTYEREIVKGDTLLGGKNYHKVYSNISSNSLVGFYREFSKKIYGKIISHPDTSEILIYDFNLNVGDTFYDKRFDFNISQQFYYKYVLNSFTTTTLTSDIRKQYNFSFEGYQGAPSTYSNLGSVCNFFWIEGIGSLKGVFNNRAPGEGTACYVAALISNASFSMLQCFEHKNIQYMSKSCITLKLGEFAENSLLKIYPQPANDKLILEFENATVEENFQLKILNNLGQIIREKEITFKDKKVSIQISDLENGIYFLNLKNDKSGTASKKFVVSQ